MDEFTPMPDGFTTVITSREFEFVEGGASSALLVEIGAPIQEVGTPPTADWRCPVRFSGGKLDAIRSAIGIDSYQSLRLAFKMVQHTLVELESQFGGKVRFLESDILPWIDDDPEHPASGGA